MEEANVAVYIALVMGLVQVLKMALDGIIPERFLPVLAIVLGLAIGLYDHMGLITSLTIGLSAMGLYSGGKTITKK